MKLTNDDRDVLRRAEETVVEHINTLSAQFGGNGVDFRKMRDFSHLKQLRADLREMQGRGQ